MPTSYALTPHFDGFIQEQLVSGRYNNASEVVRDALRLLEREQRAEAVKLDALRRAAVEGFADLDAGRFTEVDVADVEAYVSALGAPVPAMKRKAAARRR